jgi:hypothetical protein
MTEFTIDCGYCPSAEIIFKAALPAEADELTWRKMWKATTTAGPGDTPLYKVGCADCGAYFQIEDDGIPVSSGGFVRSKNVTQPKITGINLASGPREGGNILVITGDALEHGTLVVSFDGKPSPLVDQRTRKNARVVLPFGSYRLNVHETLHTLTLSIISGSLGIDEAITTSNGSTGVIRHINGNVYTVVFQALVEELGHAFKQPPKKAKNPAHERAQLTGSTLVGGVGGGTAIITNADLLTFIDGELVTGLTTRATGLARGSNSDVLIVDSPTASFGPDELVKGSTSGAMVRLSGSPAYSGKVDVTVENEYGQRLAGGTLSGAYTYA